METEFPKPGEDGYLNFVRLWKTVRLKHLNEMAHPPNHEIYEKLFDQFDEFEQKIVRIEEIRMDRDYTKCTCGTKSGHHAAECKSHPYLKIILINPDELEIAVESFLLMPISWNGKALTRTDISPSSEGSELADKVTEVELVESVDNHTEELILEIAAQSPTTAQENENERQAMEANVSTAKSKYAFVLVTKDGVIKVENVFACNDPNFVFDAKSNQWLFGDIGANCGEIVFLAEDRKDGFVGVIEADPSHLLPLISAMACYQTERIQDLLIARLKEPLTTS